MKRIVIYMLILVGVLFVPVKSNDIGKLQPVEVVQVYRQNEQVFIRTDTGDLGVGATPQLALDDLKQTTPGYIYLDTAEYLLLSSNAAQDVEVLCPELRRDIQLCIADSEIDLVLAAKFLPAHGDFPQLKQWKTGDELPFLITTGDRLKIVKKNVEKTQKTS